MNLTYLLQVLAGTCQVKGTKDAQFRYVNSYDSSFLSAEIRLIRVIRVLSCGRKLLSVVTLSVCQVARASGIGAPQLVQCDANEK